MKMLNGLDWTALVLLVIGGINWGLVGFFSFDLVASIFGYMSVLTRIIYALVGISAIYLGVVSVVFAPQSKHAQTAHHAPL